MSWERDKAVYIDKLQRVEDGITQIIRLEGNQIVTPKMEEDLLKLRVESRDLLRKLENDEFEIAIVGLESAGKSYFANALTSLHALPTADERCTYTATCIRPGSENEAHVVFYTEKDFTQDMQEKLQKLEIPDSDRYTLDNLTLPKYQQLYEKTPERVKKMYGTTLNADVVDTLKHAESLRQYIGHSKIHFAEEELGTPAFTGFITDPGKAIAVQDVTIYSTELSRMLGGSGPGDLNAVIFDVPGFNSPTAMHEAQTLDKMDHADVIVMVAKAHEPSLESAVLDIFDKPDSDGNLMKEKLFVFANKADWATDIEKNKKKTYDEWINARGILAPERKDRIIFGSAKASLGDEEAKALLAKKGVTDGMNEIRSKLVSYYTTDRFTVLRQRIDKILFDVDKLFKEAKEQYGPAAAGFNSMDRSEYNNLLLNRSDHIKRTVTDALVDLKANVNSEASRMHPLQQCLTECIDETIQPEKFALEDELVDKIDRVKAGVGMAEQVIKVNADVREKRFAAMYDAFTSSVLANTRSRHQDVSNDILRIFMDAMQTDSQSADSLEEEIVRFCGLGELPEGTEDVYYQSLLERFARDLFEIQIKFVPGVDRRNKFREEAANFFSLGVFFNANRSQETGGAANENKRCRNELGYVNETPAQSALWRLLLYPDRAAALMDETPRRRVLELTGLSELDETCEQLLNQVVIARGLDAAAAVQKAFSEIVLGKSQVNDIVARQLRSILGDEELSPEEVVDGGQYLLDIAEKQKDYDKKKLQEEFTDDINALRMVLQNAFVPAVSIDKAFTARESKLIEDIIARVNSEDFNSFVSRNFSKIAASELRGFERDEAQRQLNTAVMKEIQSILDKISGTGASLQGT